MWPKYYGLQFFKIDYAVYIIYYAFLYLLFLLFYSDNYNIA